MNFDKQKGPLCIIAASVCWSLGGVCIAFIPWGAMSIIGIRSFLAAIVFIIYKKSVKVNFTKGNILSALCLAATIILFVFANKLTTAAAAILLQFSAPVFIILIHLFFYKKKPRISEIVAVLVTIAGMLLFFFDQLDEGALIGNILAICSGMTFAGVFVCNKRDDCVPEQAILLGFAINAVIGLPFAFFQVTADISAWIAVFILGIVQVGFAYIFFSIGIKRTPALLACLITAMEPVLNPAWVAIATREIPGKFTILGGTVIVITVVLYNFWLDKHPEKPEILKILK
ncbi:MAG: DMT family transporter [Lachnospiraceae bacterium]|nr:DMT family transporter [Lachnospiraceae bacterium]